MSRIKQTLFILVLIISGLSTAYTQTDFEKGRKLFELGNYNESLTIFQKILNTYPNDPEYNYYAGLSLYHLGTDWTQCLEFLNKAEGGETQPKLNYYLGRAYLNALLPEKAYLHLLEYKAKKSRFALNNDDTDQWIIASKNLQNAIKDVTSYETTTNTTLDEKGYKTYNQQRLPTGSWVTKDDVFFIEAGIKAKNTMVFQPSLMQSGVQCIFLTGSKGVFSTDADIYKYCEEPEIYEKQIESLPNKINTNFDEQQAVFIPSENTLYFSSNKPDGYGGFDIYKSTFNPTSGNWSDPVNLGFPVNTPFDEFYLGPGSVDQKEFFITTNRYTAKAHWQIFGLLETDANPVNLSQNQEARLAAAQFKPFENRSEQIRTPLAKNNLTDDKENQPTLDINEEKYNQILEAALDMQLKADSIHRLADKQRAILSAAETTTERMTAVRKIEALESEADIIQKKADIEFAKARKMELMAEENLQNQFPKDSENKDSQSPVIDRTTIKERLGNSSRQDNETNNRPPSSNEFAVYATSVYSNTKPFNMEYKVKKGLLYRIQLGVFSKPIAYDHFGGLWPITGEELANNSMKKYYVGLFSHRTEAEQALISVRKEGFTDAFIVAWFNGKKVSLNRASDIESTLFSNSSLP